MFTDVGTPALRALFLFLNSVDGYRFRPVKKQSAGNQTKSGDKRERQRKASAGPAPAKPTGTSSTVQNLFSIDSRSLALFRMAIAALLLTDLAIRATDLNAMYTDDGMFPRALICRLATSIWNWSFHFGGGSWGYQAMLFGVAAVLAMALFVGVESRIAAIGSWLMLVSLHHRVPAILSGAEILLRVLLFWAMFLPLERTWSVDRWLRKRRGDVATPGDPSPVLSVASAAILLQMALMYFFSAIFKTNAQWLRGDVIAGTLAHDFFASPLGAHLLQYPRMLAVMTWASFALEWAAPLLLFFPKGTARLRMVLIAVLAAMHLSIALFLEVGLFSYVAVAGLVLFLPAEFWNGRLLARFSRSSEPNKQAAGRYALEKRSWPFYATQGLCFALLIYVVAVNINGLPRRPLAPLTPEKWRPFATALGLGQKWGMFDSIPSMDGWYIAKATLRDGSEVDLLRRGAEVDWTRPKYPTRVYPNYFWQKLFREMAYHDEQGFQLLRAPVAEYLCRDWNSRHAGPKQVAKFELFFCMLDKTKTTPPLRVFRQQLVHLDMDEF